MWPGMCYHQLISVCAVRSDLKKKTMKPSIMLSCAHGQWDKIRTMNHAKNFFFFSFQAVRVHNDVANTGMQLKQKLDQWFWIIRKKRSNAF